MEFHTLWGTGAGTCQQSQPLAQSTWARLILKHLHCRLYLVYSGFLGLQQKLLYYTGQQSVTRHSSLHWVTVGRNQPTISQAHTHVYNYTCMYTEVFSPNNNNGSELLNAAVLSLFRHTACSTSVSIHGKTLKVDKTTATTVDGNS